MVNYLKYSLNNQQLKCLNKNKAKPLQFTQEEIFVDRIKIILGIGIFGGRTVSLLHKQKEDQWNISAL